VCLEALVCVLCQRLGQPRKVLPGHLPKIEVATGIDGPYRLVDQNELWFDGELLEKCSVYGKCQFRDDVSLHGAVRNEWDADQPRVDRCQLLEQTEGSGPRQLPSFPRQGGKARCDRHSCDPDAQGEKLDHTLPRSGSGAS